MASLDKYEQLVGESQDVKIKIEEKVSKRKTLEDFAKCLKEQ